MSVRLRRLLPLGPAAARAGPPGRAGPAGGGTTAAVEAGACGAKAARLSAALRAGFPVLPGWVVPAAESRPAVRAAAAVLRGGQPAAGRRTVLSYPPDPALAAELREAATRLGGRVIVRSSSQLEADPRWSGAFSTVAGVGPDEVMTAVRSCWASAFAVDPLARLGSCGLPLEALELAVLLQPEICPAAGGVARVVPPAPGGRPARVDPPAPGSKAAGVSRPAAAGPGCVEVVVAGVEGHPGPLLTGWADGASARVSLPGPAADGSLLDLLGRDLVISVAWLAAGVHRCLGDDTIEWAVQDGQVWLLQSRPVQSAPADPGPGPDCAGAPCPVDAPSSTGCLSGNRAPSSTGAPGPDLAARERMPLLSAAVRQRGRHLRGRPAVAGQAAGRLVACRPHERPPAASRDAILLIDRPLPALAPLLFTARGVLARSGAGGSHLAEVARSLSVPMVTGCHPETVTGAGPPGASWLAAIDGTTGDVALFPG
jgi:phosphoenolpyruvate synthase/pyruvate phosphate dikinase